MKPGALILLWSLTKQQQAHMNHELESRIESLERELKHVREDAEKELESFRELVSKMAGNGT